MTRHWVRQQREEAVPVERVRLDRRTVTEQETVTSDVRKERIELLDADGTTDGTDDIGTTGRRR